MSHNVVIDPISPPTPRKDNKIFVQKITLNVPHLNVIFFVACLIYAEYFIKICSYVLSNCS